MKFRHEFQYPAQSIPVDFVIGHLWRICNTYITYEDPVNICDPSDEGTLVFHHEIIDVQ